jgi:hypothetical protein
MSLGVVENGCFNSLFAGAANITKMRQQKIKLLKIIF